METMVEATRYQALVEGFVTFLTTGAAPAGLLQPDVFVDLTTPLWRQQVQGAEELVAVRKLSHPALEEGFLVRGDLLRLHAENRQLLREVMGEAGWRGIRTEWWHFDGGDRERIRAEYLRIL